MHNKPNLQDLFLTNNNSSQKSTTTIKNTPLLTFPCEFPIKIMGLNHEDLIPMICAIILAHCATFNPEADVQIKPSSKNKYLAVTATIIATSQEQLDTIYRALNAHELVKVTL